MCRHAHRPPPLFAVWIAVLLASVAAWVALVWVAASIADALVSVPWLT